MPDSSQPERHKAKQAPRPSHLRHGKVGRSGSIPPACVEVGQHLRDLRAARGVSIRLLADQSGLNVNTLSLIENGKSSPSVGTLQLLANALDVPITAFFEGNPRKSSISYLKASQRRRITFAHGTLEDLGSGLTLHGGQPLLVTMEPMTDSGATPIVHTGHEFVFCLEGQLMYLIESNLYQLEPGDSLLFEAHLPHCWRNMGSTPARLLLIMCPADESDQPAMRHFKIE